jgi:hypothetical protein
LYNAIIAIKDLVDQLQKIITYLGFLYGLFINYVSQIGEKAAGNILVYCNGNTNPFI